MYATCLSTHSRLKQDVSKFFLYYRNFCKTVFRKYRDTIENNILWLYLMLSSCSHISLSFLLSLEITKANENAVCLAENTQLEL